METTADKNTATLLQLSALTQYVFPLGNLIFPALIWSLKKNESEFIDHNGRQAINFQLSLFLYSFLLVVIAIPMFVYSFFDGFSFVVDFNGDWNVKDFSLGKMTWLVMLGILSVCLAAGLKIAEFFLIIYASVKSNNGERYKFPLTINFIK